MTRRKQTNGAHNIIKPILDSNPHGIISLEFNHSLNFVYPGSDVYRPVLAWIAGISELFLHRMQIQQHFEFLDS